MDTEAWSQPWWISDQIRGSKADYALTWGCTPSYGFFSHYSQGYVAAAISYNSASRMTKAVFDTGQNYTVSYSPDLSRVDELRFVAANGTLIRREKFTYDALNRIVGIKRSLGNQTTTFLVKYNSSDANNTLTNMPMLIVAGQPLWPSSTYHFDNKVDPPDGKIVSVQVKRWSKGWFDYFFACDVIYLPSSVASRRVSSFSCGISSNVCQYNTTQEGRVNSDTSYFAGNDDFPPNNVTVAALSFDASNRLTEWKSFEKACCIFHASFREW